MAVIAPSVALRAGRSGRVLRRVAAPLSVAVVLAVTLLWLSSSTLDSIEQRTLNPGYILARVGEHVVLTVTASALVAVLAIPAGIAVYRAKSKVFHTVVLGLANIGQATPAECSWICSIPCHLLPSTSFTPL